MHGRKNIKGCKALKNRKQTGNNSMGKTLVYVLIEKKNVPATKSATNSTHLYKPNVTISC